MPRVGIVILAAGGSQRLGQPKQLLTIGQEPLLRRITRAACASSADSVSVVLGSSAEACRQALTDLRVSVSLNPAWSTGMASSLKRGVAEIASLGFEGVLIVTVDQVALTAAVLEQFLQRFTGDPDAVIAARYDGVVGVPILFGRRWFEPLQLLSGDVGARVLARSARKVEMIDWPDGSLDIDRPEDLARLAAVS